MCPVKETMSYVLEQEGFEKKSLPLWAMEDGIHAELFPNITTTLSLIHESTPLKCREVFEFTPTCGTFPYYTKELLAPSMYCSRAEAGQLALYSLCIVSLIVHGRVCR